MPACQQPLLLLSHSVAQDSAEKERKRKRDLFMLIALGTISVPQVQTRENKANSNACVHLPI